MITLYHNPRCSKSRIALELAQQFAERHQIAMEVIDYQKTPLTLAQLQTLQQQLGTSAAEMVRSNAAEFEQLGLMQADDAQLLQALAEHPKLLQRPIAVYQQRAVIGRPPENLHDLLRAPA